MWSEIGSGCFKDFDMNTCPATVVGVAIDGFPIYGPQNCTCVSFNADGSCSVWPTSTSTYFKSSDLDNCNGRAVDSSNPTQSSDVNAEHIYEYRLTADPPYHVGCIMGKTATNSNCGITNKRQENILERALKDGAAEHLMALNEILEEAAMEVEEEEKKRKEEEEKRMEKEERKREEEREEKEEQERRVNKLRSLLKDLMNEQ